MRTYSFEFLVQRPVFWREVGADCSRRVTFKVKAPDKEAARIAAEGAANRYSDAYQRNEVE